jgi:hypothetical protein
VLRFHVEIKITEFKNVERQIAEFRLAEPFFKCPSFQLHKYKVSARQPAAGVIRKPKLDRFGYKNGISKFT